MKKNYYTLRKYWEGSLLSCSFCLYLKILSCCLVLMVAFQLNSKSGVAAAQEEPEIKPGEIVKATLKRGERHSHRLKLEAGQSIIVRLVENNIQLTLTAFTPDGEVQSASEISAGGLIYENLLIVAEKSGYYRIEVSCYRPGTYAILPESPHQTKDWDRKYLAALKISRDIIEVFKDPSLSQNQKFQYAVEKTADKLSIYQTLGDPKLVIVALTDLGYYFKSLDDTFKSFKYFKEALELIGKIEPTDDRSHILLQTCAILSGLAEVSQRLGDYQKALDYYDQSLNLTRANLDENSRNSYSKTLHSTGVIYHLLADEQKALEFYELSLIVRRTIIPQTDVHLLSQGITLTNIGNLYRGIGADELALDFFDSKTANDRQIAIGYYKQALELSKITKNKGLESFSRVKIGNTYKELGNYTEALSYLEPLESNKYPSKDRFTILRSLGNLYWQKGEFQKGLPYYEQALALLEKLDNNPASIIAVAKDYYEAGETQKALDLFDRALKISRERARSGDLASSLFEIARIERELGNFNTARKNIEEAIQIAESTRARITADELRTIYFSTVKRYYAFYIDLMMQAHKSQPEKGYDSLALQTSEKARSRSLLDLLTRSGIDIRQGIDLTLLGREKAIREQLSGTANRQSRLLLGKSTAEEAAKLEQEIANILAEYSSVQTEIRSKSPRYAALTQPAPLDTKQMQQLLDSGTILLEYSLGEKKSFLWAVTPTSIESFDLPARDEIEAIAKKAYTLMTEPNRRIKDETDEQRRLRIKRADVEQPKVAAKLSEMLLGPAAGLISNKRLLMVPDGALNYIPFSALPVPGNREPEAVANAPIGLYHEVVMLPSVAALARLREETAGRKSANKLVAVFADPVFNSSDSRVAKVNRVVTDARLKNTALTRDFERAVSDVGLAATETGGLPRLPFSRREADAIFSASPKGLSLKVIDFVASKDQVFNSNLDQYRILHFATHSLLDSQHPELSGVVLSLVDKNGGDIDGFLRLQDIYNLKLNTDLVVLSACNTALGKEVRGEGLIGLTRGFMYAGAPRVVASLWKVDDAATAELMSIFYKKMLIENLRPAAALRAAQVAMMKQPRWRSPYYWAPFVLQGEWK